MEWADKALARPFGQMRPGSPEEKLDRALVAGLMVEVILDTPGLPEDPQVRRRLIKTRLQESLVSQLAGRVTLDRFRLLARRLDHWFAFYYPVLISPTQPDSLNPQSFRKEKLTPPGPDPPAGLALREDVLEAWLRHHQDLLPRRRHGKLDGPGLHNFLRLTQGGWFRLKDLQQYFQIDRKTAWEYLQKLVVAGLLAHNQGRSSAARYCLAPSFLRVRAEALRSQVELALADLPGNLATPVGDWLIATGGEAFWEEEWQGRMDQGHCQEVITRLQAASLLDVLYQSGRSKMLRLPQCWLK